MHGTSGAARGRAQDRRGRCAGRRRGGWEGCVRTSESNAPSVEHCHIFLPHRPLCLSLLGSLMTKHINPSALLTDVFLELGQQSHPASGTGNGIQICQSFVCRHDSVPLNGKTLYGVAIGCERGRKSFNSRGRHILVSSRSPLYSSTSRVRSTMPCISLQGIATIQRRGRQIF
jgi:hypothetical protein